MAKNRIREESNRRLSNLIANTLAITSFPFIFIFYLYISPILGALVIPLVIGYILTPLMNKYGKHTLARFNLLIWGSLALLLYGVCLGSDSNVISVYAPFFMIPTILFSPDESRHKLIGTGIVLLSMSSLKAMYFMDTTIQIKENYYTVLSELIWFVSIILILLFMYIFSKEQSLYEYRLKHMYDKNIRLVKEKRLLEIGTLKKLVTTLNHHINNLLVPITTGAMIIQSKMEDVSLKLLLDRIKESGFAISNLLKKISTIEQISEVEYSEGVMMIDIESSTSSTGTTKLHRD